MEHSLSGIHFRRFQFIEFFFQFIRDTYDFNVLIQEDAKVWAFTDVNVKVVLSPQLLQDLE
jgi:hypothetical protein